MPSPQEIAQKIAGRVAALPTLDRRRLIAVAGPPGSGKSTVAEVLCDLLNATGSPAGLAAMDGFHLDNAILRDRGLLARKGAPETFDLAGFRALLARLVSEDEVIVPRFDRTLDVSVGSALVISPDVRTVVVEGNYLLLDAPGWRDLSRFWDLSVFLPVDAETLEARLTQRWLDHQLAPDVAARKVRENDLPNAMLVQANRVAADLTIAQ